MSSHPSHVAAEAPAGWLEIAHLAEPAGRHGAKQKRKHDALFGARGWYQCWSFEERLVGRSAALELYEEGYFAFLRANPSVVDWLCRAASDVYDNDVSNVHSGLDYALQEKSATHLQDITLRRCLLRLDRCFAGDHLVEVRGPKSEGFVLNPGQVPFHRPEQILPVPSWRRGRWWQQGTVEAFWQQNKLIVADPSGFSLRPVLLGPEGVWATFLQRADVDLLVPPRSAASRRRTRTMPGNVRRGLWSKAPSERVHVRIEGAPALTYAELEDAQASFGQHGSPARLTWSELCADGP